MNFVGKDEEHRRNLENLENPETGRWPRFLPVEFRQAINEVKTASNQLVFDSKIKQPIPKKYRNTNIHPTTDQNINLVIIRTNAVEHSG